MFGFWVTMKLSVADHETMSLTVVLLSSISEIDYTLWSDNMTCQEHLNNCGFIQALLVSPSLEQLLLDWANAAAKTGRQLRAIFQYIADPTPFHHTWSHFIGNQSTGLRQVSIVVLFTATSLQCLKMRRLPHKHSTFVLCALPNAY